MAAAVAAAAAIAARASLDSPLQQQQQQQQQQQHYQQHYPLHLHHQHLPSRVKTSARTAAPISLSSFVGSRIDRGPSHGQLGFWSASAITPVCEVAVDGSSNAALFAGPKLETNASAEKEVDPPRKNAATQEATVSSFMADVANLVKLVDSRDIVELELKHLDYEILIRKKEALPPPPAPPQSFPPAQYFTQTPYPTYTAPPPTPPTPSPPTPTSAPNPVPATPVAAPALEHLPMLSPMAGTFYRSPAPGEPVFVKVGDKVQKGQVICIVEAMKLMNEIEADQSGTIVDILAEDRKPVSVDTPLFVIKP